MRIQRVSHSKPQKRFSLATLDCLSRSENSDELCMLGGVGRDGTFGWLARGSSLEVFLLSTGQRLSAWCFGALLKEPSTIITAVCECYYDKGSTLIVATSTINPEGLVCLFDPKNSKIVKTIEIPYAVKSLEVVSASVQRLQQQVLMSDQLKHFCGVLAVGTHCGHVYLIDLCLDDEVEGCDELSPNSLQHLDATVKDVAGRRSIAFTKGKHLYIELGEEFHVRGYYNYCKSDGTQLKSFSADDICVSCLQFVKRTAMLVVGFSFGSFQLWRLQTPLLEYSCRYDDNLPPVNSVAYQEPENDPRNYCYLWVARGPQPSDSVDDYTSGISLYQLGYEKKTWYPDFGYLFEELKAVGPRFEHDLTSDPFNPNLGGRGEGSRIISCYTIEDPNYQLPIRKSDGNDSFEGSTGPDLSLCVFVWEAASVDPHVKPPCYIGLFDMNRWYHAQMPGALRLYGGSCDVCPYFAMCSLEGVQQLAGMDNVMALHVNHRNLSRFQSILVPEPEQHFFPSALAFDVSVVTESGIVHAKYLGLQRQILSDLQSHGPSSLTEPHDLYNLCLHAGLLPRNVDLSSTSLPLPYKREALLTMALDHNMTGFIHRCATSLASGELTSDGWTLRFLLEWAWKQVGSIKENVDRLCVSLYDWSGQQLDKQTRRMLHQNHAALASLTALLNNMTSQATPTTEQGRVELSTKHKVVSLITEHLDLVLWLYSVGLLPEHSEEQLGDDCFIYPSRALSDFYQKRRAELQKLHSVVKPSEVLMIDSLIGQIGEPLSSLWEKEGGSGMYPPPSLHALVNIFLLENIPGRVKHVVVFYLLCDLFNSAPEDQRSEYYEKIQRFTWKYDMPLGLSKLIQGMWRLDHKDFEDSMFLLLDPSVRNEIEPRQHRCVVKALLYQGKPKLALQYLKIRSPPLTTPEDIKLKLTVLLANGLTAEAFEFQRISRDKNNVHDLLSHLFLGCQQTKTVDQLLLLPFSEDEECHLVNHLKTSHDMRSQELLVLYYLQRARYVEAVRLNHKLKQQHMGELDAAVRERTRVRNCLVDGYHKVLPAVQRKLCLDAERQPQQHIDSRREFARPTPLSTVVHRLNTQTLTRSSLLQTVLNKVHELKEESSDDHHSGVDSPEKDQVPGPFVCTPITPRVKCKSREVPDVVFPEVADIAPLNTTLTVPGGLSQRLSPQAPSSPYKSRPSYGMPSPLKHELSRLNTTLKRRQHLFSAEALSLLKTPPVKKKTPRKMLPVNTSVTTPHSILKVRHKPVAELVKEPVVKLNFKFEDLSMPTPPPIQRRLTLAAQTQKSVCVPVPETDEDIEPGAMDTTQEHDSNLNMDTTNKTLRFANMSPDGAAEDVSMEPEDILSCPSVRRSIRDRSPTPERKSPKIAFRPDIISPTKQSPPVDDKSEPGTQVDQSQPGLHISELHSQHGSEVVQSERKPFIIDQSDDSLVDMDDDDEVTLNIGDRTKLLADVFDDSADTIPLTSPLSVIADATPDVPVTNPDGVSSTSETDSKLMQSDLISTHVSCTSTNYGKTGEPSVDEADIDLVLVESGSSESELEMVEDHFADDEEPVQRSSVFMVDEHIEAPGESEDQCSDSVVLPTDQHDNDEQEKLDEDEEILINRSTHGNKPSHSSQPSPNTHVHQKERLVSKDVFEEGECEERITEITTPNKVTKTIKTTSITKTTSIKVIDIGSSESEDQVTTSLDTDITVDTDNDTQSEKGCGDHRHTTVELSNVEPEVLADSTSYEVTNIVNADSTSADPMDVMDAHVSNTDNMTNVEQRATENTRSRTSLTRSALKNDSPAVIAKTPSHLGKHSEENLVTTASSRRRRTKATMTTPSLNVLRDTVITPSRRSTRISQMEDAEAISEAEQSLQRPRTPTRSTRSSSRQASTSPKSLNNSPSSTAGSQPPTPTRSTRTRSGVNNRSRSPNHSPSSTAGSQPPTPTRSTKSRARVNRSRSPTSTTEPEITMTKLKQRSKVNKTPSRSSSRASSPGQSILDTGSEESFVTRMRSGQTKTPSRDTSPDSVRTLSTVDEQEKIEFKFSAPVVLSTVLDEDAIPSTPIPDFIFSPPLTRSRQKRRDSSTFTRKGLDTTLTSTNVIADISITSSPAKKTKITKTKTHTKKNDAGYMETYDSVINFVPGPTEDELDSKLSTRVTRARVKIGDKTAALPPRRGRKKRSPLKWTSIKDNL